MDEQKINAPAALERWGRGEEGSPYLLQPLSDGYWTPWHIAQQTLSEARAAVAELIEADKALDAANHALATTDPQSEDAETMEAMRAHRNRCVERRRAALARVQGDQ